ncbi:uncharacterized protein F4822DRAFT_439842 [Hypoxylon trugodes]|uniref:uncharacterized protein n=1 Tax=Hypoxylon trugodes TaxID=326681 RepID=UPI0021904A14|nr:uncharacterized protein F4822DRAFT_439842 [Hypoxylon trugodes]KAI1394059.1 hypothetical protein F4822DRAFT_439842 [Hypoxylon trugodes]
MAKQKIPRNTAITPTSRPKGTINFPPYERLDEAALRQVRKFRVHPFGNIHEHSRHIPYNSGKKDFFEKTGRESFEVFQYDFKVPGDETEFTVMWDYNVGLVRMTPFFKCCKYPKTTPAKMLNLNPGLKEITHSITGGSIMAQGYWMPYHCAKAVCATFCHNIAGALIPIFGADFPSLCTPSEAPEYQRMIIDPAIIVQSTREAERFRRLYSNPVTSASGSGSNSGRANSPRERPTLFRSPYDDPRKNHHSQHFSRRYSIRKPFPTPTSCDSPYATDTDSDISPIAPERSNMGPRDRFPYSSVAPPPPPPPPSLVAPPSLRPTSSGWVPANIVVPAHHHYDQPVPSPWLSAVPRFTTPAHLALYPPPPHTSQPQPWRGANKRSAEHVESDYEYNHNREHERRGGPTHNGERSQTIAPTIPGPSNTSTPTTISREGSGERTKPLGDSGTGILGADKNAALLLMNLSVGDTRGNQSATGVVASETNSPRDGEFPRVKRIRAQSF